MKLSHIMHKIEDINIGGDSDRLLNPTIQICKKTYKTEKITEIIYCDESIVEGPKVVFITKAYIYRDDIKPDIMVFSNPTFFGTSKNTSVGYAACILEDIFKKYVRNNKQLGLYIYNAYSIHELEQLNAINIKSNDLNNRFCYFINTRTSKNLYLS